MDCILDPKIPGEVSTFRCSYQLAHKIYKISIDLSRQKYLFNISDIAIQYMACKLFGIGDQIIKYATCPTCCKLYSVNKLPTDKPSHCSFQNFPNHPMANYRSPCGAVITKQGWLKRR